MSDVLKRSAVVEQPIDVFRQLKAALTGNTVAKTLLRGTHDRIGDKKFPASDKVFARLHSFLSKPPPHRLYHLLAGFAKGKPHCVLIPLWFACFALAPRHLQANDEHLERLHREVLDRCLATRGRDYVRAVLQKMKNNSVKTVAFRAQVAVKNQAKAKADPKSPLVAAEAEVEDDSGLVSDVLQLAEIDAVEGGELVSDASPPEVPPAARRSPPGRSAKRPRLSSSGADLVRTCSTALTEDQRCKIANNKANAIAVRAAKAQAKREVT